MRRIHSHHSFLKELSKLMSKWKDDIEGLISTIATGNGTDPETKAAVEELKTKLAEDEAAAAELETRVTAVEGDLSEAQGVITDIVTKLQAGDTAGALATAQAAAPVVDDSAK